MIPKNKFKRIYIIISVLIAGIFLWQQTAWADGAALGEKLKTANTPAGSMSSAQLSAQQTAAQSAVSSQQAIENFSTNNVGPYRLVPISAGRLPVPAPYPPGNHLPPHLWISVSATPLPGTPREPPAWTPEWTELEPGHWKDPQGNHWIWHNPNDPDNPHGEHWDFGSADGKYQARLYPDGRVDIKPESGRGPKLGEPGYGGNGKRIGI